MEKKRFPHGDKTYRVDIIKNDGRRLYFLNPLNKNVRTQKVFRGQNVDQKIHEFLDKLDEIKKKVRYNKDKLIPNNMNINLNELKLEPDIIVQNKIDLCLNDKTGNNVLIFGSTKQGKSTCMMHIYRKYFSGTITFLCSPNIQINLYNDNTEKIIKTYSYDVCQQLIKTAQKIQRKTKNNYEFTFLIDDIITRTNDPTLQNLVMVYRNSLINSIISVQYPTVISKRCRANITNMIFFRFLSPESILYVTKTFLPNFFNKYTDAKKIEKYNELTKDHQFIYYCPLTEQFTVHKLLI